MTDIDTIREALEEADSHCYTDTDSARVRSLAKTALAALERVSALNSEMEAALSFYTSICGNCGGSHISRETFQEMYQAAEKALNLKDSR